MIQPFPSVSKTTNGQPSSCTTHRVKLAYPSLLNLTQIKIYPIFSPVGYSFLLNLIQPTSGDEMKYQIENIYKYIYGSPIITLTVN